MQRLLIIILIVVVFLAFMVTYTVRFTEKAVVTTFGKADENSVITTPGLRFKVPYIQQVTKYDARSRYLESNQETQLTSDDSPILITAYMTWRVDDPLKFFRKFSAAGDTPKDHYKEAEKVLKSKLRSAMGEVSRYRFGELFSSDERGLKLSELEAKLMANLDQTSTSDGALADYGIKAISVGITRMGLPQNATRDVFQRMNAERKKIADKAIAQGQAQAATLRSEAETDAKKIRSFADRLADRIRNQGDVEAAEWVKRLDADPKLAVFIQNIELLKKMAGSRTTLVLPTSLPGLGLFKPGAMENVKAGEVPTPALDSLNSPAAKPATAPAESRENTTPAPASGGQR